MRKYFVEMVNNKTGEWHTQATFDSLQEAVDYRKRWADPNYPGIDGEDALLINSCLFDEDGEFVDGTVIEH